MGKDLTLPVQRKVKAILPRQNQRQKRGACEALLDRARRNRCLHDRRALHAALFRADLATHRKCHGLRFQDLGLIRAQFTQFSATVRTDTLARLNDFRYTLEVIGKAFAAHGLALDDWRSLDLRQRLEFALRLFYGGCELLEGQWQLTDTVEAFRGLAEPSVP